MNYRGNWHLSERVTPSSQTTVVVADGVDVRRIEAVCRTLGLDAFDVRTHPLLLAFT